MTEFEIGSKKLKNVVFTINDLVEQFEVFFNLERLYNKFLSNGPPALNAN